MTPGHVYFVVWWFDRFGGMERHVTDLALALAARGVRVTVFSETPIPDANAYARTLREGAIEVIAPRSSGGRWQRRRSGSGTDDGHLSPAMRGLLLAMTRHSRKAPPDLVHVHGCRLGQAFALQWAASRGWPTVYTEHVTIGDWGGPHDADAPRIVTSVADAIVCVSHHSRDSLREHLVQPREIAVVRHIIADPGPPEVVEALPRPVSILAVGRLAPHKGYATLLKAAARLRDEGIAFHLRVAGEGDQRRELEALRTELGLADSVTLLGEVDHAAIAALWRAADIGVMPSLTEGLPLSVVEAMAQAKPVVASRAGGIPEVIRDGDTGLLVEPGDVAALSAALARLVTEPGLAARLAASARQSFEKGGWSEAAVSEQMLEIYHAAAQLRAEGRDRTMRGGAGWCRRQAAAVAGAIERVAVCVWSLSAFGDMEAMIAEQASGLASAGVAVTLFVERPVRPFNPYVKRMRRAGVRVVVPSLAKSVVRRVWERVAGLRQAPLMQAIAAQAAPDVVHVHGWQLRCGWLLDALHTAADRGIRLVYTEHADEPAEAPLDADHHEALALMDRLSATSSAGAGFVRAASSLRAVFVAGQVDRMAPVALRGGGRPQVFALLSIPAWAALAGDLAATDVELIPAHPAGFDAAQVADCDVAVLSPDMPDFSRALAEAMAKFKPVVICGNPGPSPIQHRANGLVVSGNPAAAVLELVRDSLLAMQFALAAHRTYEAAGGRTLTVVAETIALYRPDVNDPEASGHAGG